MENGAFHSTVYWGVSATVSVLSHDNDRWELGGRGPLKWYPMHSSHEPLL